MRSEKGGMVSIQDVEVKAKDKETRRDTHTHAHTYLHTSGQASTRFSTSVTALSI